MSASLPLAGRVVLDLSRMLPGAVLARTLLDLGAELIKIEDPAGDPLRHTPPLVDGIGAGFCAFYRGALSMTVDLSTDEGAALVRRMSKRCDVLIESFRPGTLDAWGLGAARLLAGNPALVVCSLSGFGQGDSEWRRRAAHDLNFVGLAGLLGRLGGAPPGVQIADVAAGLLASSSVLAALLRRAGDGRGAHLDVPLAAAPLPFVLWPWADAARGDVSATDGLLAGRCPAYHVYRCADGLSLAVGALEPKFWSALLEILELPHLAGAGLDTGEAGAAAIAATAARFASRPRAHWLGACAARELPITAVNDVAAAREEPALQGLLAPTPLPDGGAVVLPGPFLPGLGVTPARPAPRLGEHDSVLAARFR